ncbi:hypothetical protein V7S43_010373 [Phytophthora oleae]|uniref:PexRD2 WYL domain-containing protein n=1 Tax=Phytophthora oleae TaxID=2107226 RepID=A0ABD3FI05_9STRA
MRLSFLLVAIATFLVASEAFSMAGDSRQISKVGSPVGPRQQLLRAQYTEVEFGVGEKEMNQMMSMIKSKMTKEDFAKKLKITEQIDAIINKHAPGMHEFMQTTQYKRYSNYMNFLNDMAKNSEFSALKQEIKAKSQAQVARKTFRKNTQTSQAY